MECIIPLTEAEAGVVDSLLRGDLRAILFSFHEETCLSHWESLEKPKLALLEVRISIHNLVDKFTVLLRGKLLLSTLRETIITRRWGVWATQPAVDHFLGALSVNNELLKTFALS
jgi:hypothetical protein